ncbi:hypothetical protein E3P99_01285 [Wallemia hederae]|uniref:Zinc finger Mcm10/DnaG-type domain-containing protein n=1 Tax=Wallemia hederae TaxID=1540922 RepID=A0A4T0FVB5_9BASI|nr:hypothetical protein E3P99_01285 [Wallemia hederae]
MVDQDRQHDEEIRAQIATLQAQLSSNKPQQSPQHIPQPVSNVLVPDSPPKKAAAATHDNLESSRQPLASSSSQTSRPTQLSNKKKKPAAHERVEKPSGLLNGLSKLNKTRQSGNDNDDEIDYSANKSTSFKHRREKAQNHSADNRRDEDLQIIEQLQHGPKYPEKPDHECSDFEPNSNTRLSERYMSHSNLSAALTASYVIPPSALYSVAKVSTDGTGYHVPVHDDWVVIGVVGPGSGAKETKPTQQLTAEDEVRNQNKFQNKKNVKKFCTFSIIDMNHSQSGNAHLRLILFSADQAERDDDDGEMLYRGGSGGAFEKFWKMRQGSVVALLNPNILKPHQGRGNILGVTVVNADSICVIGHSTDYGHCEAQKQNGERCSKWIDKRRGKVCDVHLQVGVERTRNSRPEFSSGTMGMGMSAKKDRFRSNNPTRGFEAKDRKFAGFRDPYDTNYTPTYTFSGITTTNTEQNSSGNYGREKEERLKRKRQRDESEKVIKDLSKPKKSRSASTSSGSKQDGDSADARRTIFHHHHVRKIGFNPAGSAHRDLKDANNDALKKDHLIQSLRLKTGPASQTKEAPEEKKEEKVEEERMVVLDTSCLPDITTMLSDIVEKDVSSPAKAPAPPTAPSHGFPAPKMRSKFKSSRQKTDAAAPSTSAIATAASTVSDQSIDSENRNVLAKMSQQEILEEQADIEEKLGPKMVEFLRKRAEKSAARDSPAQINDKDSIEIPSKTDDSEERDEKDQLKEGAAKVQRKSVRIQTAQATSPSREKEQDSTQQLIRDKYFPDADFNEDQHSWLTSLPPPSAKDTKDVLRFDFSGGIMSQHTQAYLQGMHHHGRDQGSPGYTIDEFLMLSGSVNVSQRILALRSLSHVLLKWYKQEYSEEEASKLDYVQLGKATLALRFAMNDTNRSVVVAGLSGVASIVLQHMQLDQVLDDNLSLSLTNAECASSALKVYSGQLTLKPDEMRELLSSPLAFLTFRTDLADTLNDLLKGTAAISDDITELKKVSSIVYALSRHSVKTANECVNTPLFLERVMRTFIEKPWPSDEHPDALAISALRHIAATSRSNAHAVRTAKVVDVASRYLTLLPFNSSRRESWPLATETLKLMSTLATYGLIQGTAVIDTASIDCARWLSNKDHKSTPTSTAFVVALFNLLKVWTICAIDPHHTTPHHIIVWTQVEGFVDLALVGLEGVQDESALSSIWAYLSVWLRGNKGIVDKKGWLAEHLDLQSVKAEADKRSQLALDLFSRGNVKESAAHISILNAAAQMLSHSDGYTISTELSEAIVENAMEASSVVYNYLRPGLDLMGRSLMQSSIEKPSQLKLALRLLTVLKEGDETLVVDLLTHVLKSTPVQLISSVTTFPEREADAAKTTTLPLLVESAKLMLVDGIYAGVTVQSQHVSQISSLTLPHDANTLLFDKWALKMTLDELAQSARSEALKNLPADWDYSEVDLVMGALTLQELVDRVLPTSSSALLLQLMCVFLLELGVEGGEVFRHPRVQSALKRVLHRVLTELEKDTMTLESAQEEVKSEVPFYQLYTDYVGLFESISLGDANTAAMLFPPLLLADEYRRLLWVDHGNCIKSIRLSWTDFPKWFVGKLLYPLEHNVDVIKAYAKAVSSRSLGLEMQPLVYWIALHHSALTLWSTQDDALRRHLIVSLLSSHPDIAKVAILYDNSAEDLKLPSQAHASPAEVERRLEVLKSNDEKLLSEKLAALLTL